MKNKLLTTAEITDSHIKVIQAIASRDDVTITFCDIREIRPQSDAQISKVLSDVFQTGKIRADNLVATIPRRFSIVRNLSLPSHADAEIEKMVNLQVVKQVPYPREDIVLDFRVLYKEPSGYSKVLVVAVHKEVVSRYLKIFKDAGLTVSNLTLSSEGLLSWHNYYIKKSVRKPEGPTLLINVDTLNTEICFCHNENLLFSRSVNFGAKDLTAEHLAAFVEQVELTVSTYAKENIGGDISRIVLTSSLREIGLLKEKLEIDYNASLQARTPKQEAPGEKAGVSVDIVDPLLKGIRQKKGLGLSSIAREHNTSFTVTTGLALSTSKKLINLLSVEVRDTRKIHQERQELIRFLAMLVCAFVLGVAVFAIKIYKHTAYLKELQGAIDTTQPKVVAVKEKIKRLNFVRARLNPDISINDIIYELYSITPAEISFKSVHLAENGTLSIQGISEQAASVNVLQRNLVNSALFENVTLQYATKRKVFKGEFTDFKIVCQTSEKAR